MRLGASSNAKSVAVISATHTHMYSYLPYTLATLVAMQQLSLGAHSKCNMHSASWASSSTSLQLLLCLCHKVKHNKITHKNHTHTPSHTLPYFYYLWLLQVKWICQICLNNSWQKFLRWVLSACVCLSLYISCNLWHSLLLWQVDLISKFIFDLGNSLPSLLVVAWIYDLVFSSLWHQ